MSSARERRRAERRKRKARSAERRAQMAARSEARDEAARQALEPLGEGERPGVVTAGALLSAAVAASIVIAWLAGANVNGERPAVGQVLIPAALMGLMAYGMWRARYWAVLGFEAILVLLILAAALGLVGAHSVAQLAGNLALIAVATTLFVLMIKAMARIQMPERAPRD